MSTTEHRLPVKLLALVGVAVLAVGAAGYAITGAPRLAMNPPQPAAAAHAPGAEQIAAMVDQLAQRLKDKPDDPEGWAMLGRSYMVLGRLNDAVPAFRRAVQLRGEDAGVLAEAAMAIASAENRMTDEADALLQRALKAEPDNLRALSLAGSAAFDRQDWAGAVKHWERILAVAPPGSDFLPQVQAGVDEARQRGGLPPAAGAAKPPVAAASAAIRGRVTLAAALKSQAAPEDTVFVFARAAEGPRVPLAIVRRQVKDLPFDFVLDDSSAMSPATRLSATSGAVLVGARISKSGDAMPQPGDLAGQAGPVAVGTSGVAVEISQPVQAAAR